MNDSSATPSPAHDRLTLRKAIAADARAANLVRGVALVVVLVLLFFEWGAGNETIQVTAIASTYDRNPSWVGVGLVFVVGFAVAFAIQLIAGSISSVGYGALSNITTVARNFLLRLRPDLEGTNWQTLGWGPKFFLSFAVGASAVVLLQQTSTGQTGFAAHRRVVMQSALLMSTGVALVGAVLAAAAQIGRMVPAFEPAVDAFIGFASSPWPWFVLFTTIAVVAWYRSRPEDR
jgi:hypothetical protein